jgi:hypothetical protein
MKLSIKAAVLSGAAVVAAAAIGAGTLSQAASPSASETPVPAATVQTSFPGLAAAQGEPDLPQLQIAHPQPGQAIQVNGPFDDRFVLENTAFTNTAATGTIRITSDVSDLLELQILAGFYDDKGALLGTGRFEHHAGQEAHNHEGPPSETEAFTIDVPAGLAGKAVSAALGVPVLVNE